MSDTSDAPLWYGLVCEEFFKAKPQSVDSNRQDPAFEAFQLVTRSRISVVPASAEHFKRVLTLGKTKLPR